MPALPAYRLGTQALSILLAFVMVFGPWEFQQAAQGASLYSQISRTDWATAGTSVEYDYDDNGACTYKAKWNGAVGSGTKTEEVVNTYNLQGRLAKITTDADPTAGDNWLDVVQYAYNDVGIRVEAYRYELKQDTQAVQNESTTTYLIDPANPTGYAQTVEEWTGGSTPAVTYTIGDDVIAQSKAGAVTFLLYDGHGSTRQLARYDDGVTGDVAIDECHSYDGYGVRLGNQAEPTTDTSLLYTGEHYDTDASQYYLRARWYDPANGRFNRVDPYAGNMQDPQSLHKYLYCHANPVNATDPTGMWTFIGVCAVVAITATILSIAIPVTTGVIVSAKAGVSPWEFISELGNIDTWEEALIGLGIGAIGGAAMNALARELGEKAFSFIGAVMALWSLAESIKLSWQMAQGTMSRQDLAHFFAVMTATIIITVAIGKIAQKNRGSGQSADPSVDLELKYKEGWSADQRLQANAKVEALSAGDTSVNHNAVRRGGTRMRYKKAGGQISGTQDVDHIIDLQLGGADEISNMSGLDRSVNRSLGAQLHQLINNLPDGTKIGNVTIVDR